VGVRAGVVGGREKLVPSTEADIGTLGEFGRVGVILAPFVIADGSVGRGCVTGVVAAVGGRTGEVGGETRGRIPGANNTPAACVTGVLLEKGTIGVDAKAVVVGVVDIGEKTAGFAVGEETAELGGRATT
jgi:hypothetical protein